MQEIRIKHNLDEIIRKAKIAQRAIKDLNSTKIKIETIPTDNIVPCTYSHSFDLEHICISCGMTVKEFEDTFK